MLPSFATYTVTRIRPAAQTERGSSFRDWENATEAAIAGCHVQPNDTSMDMDDREQTVMTYTLYAPVGADVLRGDRIAYGGHTYDVVGVPFDWYSPTNAVSHMTCRMTEWVG